MSKMAPEFLNSPYFVGDVDNWHLKEGAPESVRKEFEDYMSHPDCINVSDMSEGEYFKMFFGNSTTSQ